MCANACPTDQAAALELSNRRAGHIHGRVGYAEGPQVPDPSAPEVAAELAWHETQWQQIRDLHTKAGVDSLTFTPESARRRICIRCHTPMCRSPIVAGLPVGGAAGAPAIST